jgi:site-specific recombinase XerD
VNLAVPIWQSAKTSKPVADVVDLLLAERKKDGTGKRHLDAMGQILKKFKTDFGKMLIASITDDAVKGWLHKPRKEPLSNASKNHYRRILSLLWEYAIDHKWCSENAVLKVKQLKEKRGKVAVLTINEAVRLLAATPTRSRSYVAISLFCGLRRSELERIAPASIRASGVIEVENIKTRNRGAARRFIPIRANLAEWLKLHPLAEVLTPQQIRKDFETAIKTAKIKWVRDITRHSFCSYALEHEKDVKALTLEMGHTNPSMIFAHYRELVTPEDAALYWGLTPEKAKEVAGGPSTVRTQ